MLRAPNPVLWWVVGRTLAALYVRPIADIFRFSPVGPVDFALAAVAGLSGVLWYEGYKLVRDKPQTRDPRRASL